MQPVKQYKQENSENPFQFCDNFIKDPTSVYFLTKEWKERFSNTLSLMFKTINKMEKDETVEDFSFTPIEECLNYFLSLTVEKIMNEREKKFIRAFIFLAFNINENLDKYAGVKNKISQLQRYCDDRMTFSEYVMLMRRINDRVARWRDWTPPSFRLSKHYYNLLKED